MKVTYEKSEKGILDKLSYAWILYYIKWKQDNINFNFVGTIYFNYSKTITVLNWNSFSGKIYTFQYLKSVNHSSNPKIT